MTHIIDATRAIGRLERTVEDRQVLFAKVRSALDRVVLVDKFDNPADVILRVPQAIQRLRDRLVDDLEHPTAREVFVLDQRDVRLDARRVAVHHKPNRPGRRENRHLGIAIPMGRSCLQRLVPAMAGGVEKLRRAELRVDGLDGVAVHFDDVEHVVAVAIKLRERANP